MSPEQYAKARRLFRRMIMALALLPFVATGTALALGASTRAVLGVAIPLAAVALIWGATACLELRLHPER
jgi:hypothetical protein